MKVLSRVLAISLLVSAPHAGAIRVILGGGGFAEMQALTAWSQIPRLFDLCRMRPEACSLSTDEIKLVGALAKNPSLLETSRGSLSFFATTQSAQIHYDVQAGGDVHMASSLLYGNNGIAKPFDEIATIVFDAWVRHPWRQAELAHAQIEIPDLLQFGRRLFHSLVLRERAIALTDSDLTVHHLILSISGHNTQILALENSFETLDLSPVITEAVKCSTSVKPTDFSYANLATVSRALVGQIFWRCAQQRMSARFNLSVTQNALVVPPGLNDVRMTFSALREVPLESSGACNELLGGPIAKGSE